MSIQVENESNRTPPPGFFTKYREYLLSMGFITAVVNTVFLIVGFAFELSGNHQYADYSFLISAVVGGFPVFKLAVGNILRDFDLTAGVMVSVAMIAALIVGEYGAMALVAFMMVIGEAMEDFTRERANHALKELNQLIPAMVTIRMDDKDYDVPIGQVRKGDIALIRPGGRVPVDGIVVDGEAAVDQSSLTGESMPIDLTVGSNVYAGTLVSSGSLSVEVESVGETTSLGKMIHLVEEAQSTQAPVQRIANRYAQFFAPVAIVIAGITWWITGEPLSARLKEYMTSYWLTQPWRYDSEASQRGKADNHYATMVTKDICDLQVPSAENALLFLWVTNTHVPDALKVIDAWGFRYLTYFVWVKDMIGLGWWMRGQHETLFLCMKGKIHV